jgi:hypothetical protein
LNSYALYIYFQGEPVKLPKILLFVMLSGAIALAQQSLNPAKVPLQAASAAQFAPAGWRVESSTSADLDGDGKTDLALVLVAAGGGSDDGRERNRALLIALRTATGYERVGLGTAALPCTRCGGAFWGTQTLPITMSVQKNVVVVSFETGSRELNSLTFRYRLGQTTASKRQVQLIGVDSVLFDRGTGAWQETSTNYLNGKRIVSRGQSDQDGKRGTPTTSTTTLKIATPVLSGVDYTKFY